MIALPKPLAATKIARAPTRTVLLKDGIDASLGKLSEQEIGGIDRITEQHIAGLETREQRSAERCSLLPLPW